MKILRLVLLMCFLPLCASAATIYVDNNVGCPGSGTTGSPYCSIQNAFNVVNAGDTIRIRSGTGIYDQAASVVSRSGSSGNPIILEPDTGASFIIRNSNCGANEAAILIQDSDYWTIRNLTFDGASVCTSYYAVKISPENRSTTNITISGNTFKNWMSGNSFNDYANGEALVISSGCIPFLGCGSAARGVTNLLVQNNVFDANRRVSFLAVETVNAVIDGNEIKNQQCGRNGPPGSSDTTGIEVGMHLTFENTGMQVTNNQIHDFVISDSCTVTNQVFASWAGIWCDVGGYNFTVTGNTIWNINQDRRDQFNPNGLNVASQAVFVEDGCNGFHVNNNVIYSIGNFGVRNDYHSLDVNQPPNIYDHNTMYNTYLNAYKVTQGVLTIRNSIHSSQSIHDFIHIDDPALVQLTADYNLYYANSQTFLNVIGGTGYNTLSSWNAACSCDSHSINADPLFVNAASANFHLGAGSPAIGTASDGTNMGALVTSGGPTFTFTASTPVSSGQQSTLTWSAVTNATSCTASVLSGQADTAWSTAGSGPTSAQLLAGGSKLSTARTSTTTYRMSCTDGITTVNLDRTVTISVPPLTIGFSDNFNDNSQNTSLWTVGALVFDTTSTGVTVSETSQQLQITPETSQSGLRYNGYTTVNSYNLTAGACVSVEVVQATLNVGGGNADTQIKIGPDSNNYYGITKEGTSLYFTDTVGGTSDFSNFVTYVNATHRWWQICYDQPTDHILFNTSTDGSSWTNRRNIQRVVPVTAVKAEVNAGTYASQATPGVAIFDNFVLSIVGCTTPVAGSPYPRSSVITCIDWDFAGTITLASNALYGGGNGSDLWLPTWASDGNLYSGWGDGTGFSPSGYIQTGVAKITTGTPVSGQASSITGCNVNGGGNSGGTCAATVSGTFVEPGPRCVTGGNCKILQMIAAPCTGLSGCAGHSRIYLWYSPDSGASSLLIMLAWSDDFGATWTFSQSSLTSCTVTSGNGVCIQNLGGSSVQLFTQAWLQWGQDHAGNDGYFYLYYGTNANLLDLYLQRIPVSPTSAILTQSTYQWFTGFDGSGNPTWNTNFASRVPVFTDPNNLNMSQDAHVTYHASINKFILTMSHGGPGGLGIFESSHPWGESGVGWHTVAYYPLTVGSTWGPGGGYNQQSCPGPSLCAEEGLPYTFIQKWTSLSGTTLTSWLVHSSIDAFIATQATMTVVTPTDLLAPAAPTNLRVISP